jgi:vacuolar protein sorting-associated protein 13A/C
MLHCTNPTDSEYFQQALMCHIDSFSEVGEDAVLGTDVTVEPAPPTGEICILTAPSIVITMEAGVGSQTLPMILVDIGFQGSVTDWSTQVSSESCINELIFFFFAESY